MPVVMAQQILELRPHLRTAALPFRHQPGEIELLWPKALDDDPACHFIREAIVRITDARMKRLPRQLRAP